MYNLLGSNCADNADEIPNYLLQSRKLEVMITDILEFYLRNDRYHSDRCGKLTHDMCDIIKVKAKELLNNDEYRLVVQVLVGEDTDNIV